MGTFGSTPTFGAKPGHAHSPCLSPTPACEAIATETERRELLPGTYEYRTRDGGATRVTDKNCYLILNDEDDKQTSSVALTYGEPFQFTFYTYHGSVQLYHCDKGALYRIGDWPAKITVESLWVRAQRQGTS